VARVGIYPGSFNPPTTAHVAIAAAVRRQRGLDRVVLAHSLQVLGKDIVERPLFRHRAEVLAAVAAEYAWLEALVTDKRLLADIAEGYDVVVMGADKWHQIHEVQWYDEDESIRDATLARLPEVAVAPRPPLVVPPELVLDLPTELVDGISSTAARNGNLGHMAPAARRFAIESGAWIDPERYEQWLEGQGPEGA
jgi:nicotinic acid mononucleotide adenylyltransferase